MDAQTAGDQALADRVRSWFADSAYGTGDLRAAIAAAGHRAVIKPKPLQVAVPRTVAQVATRGGRRLKLRYRGTIKNNAWLKRRTAALNLRNLIGRGLTHQDGTWTLATT